MAFCNSCGATLDGGAKFCTKCGATQPALQPPHSRVHPCRGRSWLPAEKR